MLYACELHILQAFYYSRTRLKRTRDKTYFGLVRTHLLEPKFIYYIDIVEF